MFLPNHLASSPADGMVNLPLDEALRALKGRSSERREEAARALEEIGKDDPEKILPQLLEALKDDSYETALFLGKFGKGAPEKVLPKLQHALQDSNANLRSGAARALGAMGGAAIPAIPQLGEALQDSNENVRARAAEALWRMLNELPRLPSTHKSEMQKMQQEIAPLMPQLRQALRDSSGEVRSFAAYILTCLGKAAAPAVPQLQEALGDDEWLVRSAAAKALKAVGKEAEVAVPQLQIALKDSVADVRSAAASTLQVLVALPRHLKVLRQDPDWRVQVAAARDVESMGKDAAMAVPQLAEALKDINQNVCLAAAHALGVLGKDLPKQVLPKLWEALGDFYESIRQAAAYGLGVMGKEIPDEVLPKVLAALKDRDSNFRAAAARALGVMGKEGAVAGPLLLKALKDPDDDVHEAAAGALQEIGREAPKKILPQLLEALQDSESWRIRLVAVTALKACGKEAAAAVPQLRMALKDSDKDVRSAAASTLQMLVQLWRNPIH